ncbi:ComF family protein [Candidatus Tisiphia endosymbiont of Ptychoptera albimana]|uniref:ComF family protein n=1 Tax=unclassified Candidatus Tisiphia TaxID=2996318 RepID=UPI001D25A946|nr:ComF family protein [Rickettsia endosymbiont of Sericostoma sp. HW-2014]
MLHYVHKISRLYDYLIDYILPARCLSCTEMTETKEDFCQNCWKKLDFITKPYCIICGSRLDISILDNMCCAKCFQHKPCYDKSRSLIKFNEHSKKIIHAFKYQDKTILAKTFSKLFYTHYNSEIQDIDLIIPVPMNRFKRLFRMYNPALILALEISKLARKSFSPDVLIKSKWTKSQTFLSKKEREKNLSNSLILNKKYQIIGQKILLVDDVLTTGTTVNKCAKILKDSGAECVYVMTIAMT